MTTKSKGTPKGGQELNAAPFIKAMRSAEGPELVARSKNAFVLLYIIAQRAQRTSAFNRYNLSPGEAAIGDFENYDLTEQEYRTAKKFLSDSGFATFKATNKGTVAKLMNSMVFDINADTINGQVNTRATDSQRTSNGQATTTKNVKKEKNDKNEKGKAPPNGSYRENPERIKYAKEAQGAVALIEKELASIRLELKDGRTTPDKAEQLKARREELKLKKWELYPLATGGLSAPGEFGSNKKPYGRDLNAGFGPGGEVRGARVADAAKRRSQATSSPDEKPVGEKVPERVHQPMITAFCEVCTAKMLIVPSTGQGFCKICSDQRKGKQ